MSTRYEGAWNRCDVCGRFIPYDDFAGGHAERNLITPDSAFTREEWETLCHRHIEKRQRPAEAPQMNDGTIEYLATRTKETPAPYGLPKPCRTWTAAVNHGGYGKASRGDRDILAHRLSYLLHVGEIPEGLFVLHHCDVAACCEPSHLYVGTAADNARDAVVRGRLPPPWNKLPPGVPRKPRGPHKPDPNAPGRPPRGTEHYRAKLTEDAVRAIRADGRKYAHIAADHGVSQSTVGEVKRREKWSHVL